MELLFTDSSYVVQRRSSAVTGSFTIPLMMRFGVPGAFAAAVETAVYMGGLIMPPLMAVAGFLMSEFMGVPYWDVVIRGFALSFVYFAIFFPAVGYLAVLMGWRNYGALRAALYTAS